MIALVRAAVTLAAALTACPSSSVEVTFALSEPNGSQEELPGSLPEGEAPSDAEGGKEPVQDDDPTSSADLAALHLPAPKSCTVPTCGDAIGPRHGHAWSLDRPPRG